MRKVLYTTLVIALLSSCGKNNEPEPVPPTPPAAELPEPPAEMNANNTFAVDYFTDLKDKDSYFARRDVSIAKNHILGAEGKKAVIFFFDRMDFTVGDSNPFMKICRDNNIWPYFVQQEPTGMQVTKGCGIITKTAIADFDGIYDSDVFLGGADIHIQTGIPGRTTIYTSRIDKMAQLDEIFSKKSLKLSENAVIIGRVKNGLEKELETKVASYSCRSFISEGVEGWSLYVICPPEYVCRTAESKKTVNLDYYRITIEKIKL